MQFQTTRTLILASASPRRKELIERLNVPFSIYTADVDEQSIAVLTPEQYVKDVALLKARAVAKMHQNAVVIGADTTVAQGNTLLHKPADAAEALAHLQALRGKTHHVLTAVAIIEEDGRETVFVEKTAVTFKHVSDELLHAYIATGDPFDKAGGYGIQTDGMFLVERIEGDYLNVVGLPLATVCEQLLSQRIITL
ncbi:Maf family protein [Caryophanon latum]|uniref:dTTP/UTP pyrophosphatase n=1 Tax=Caryophanon latum TaxID=33977 RepID=A0A1C0Z5P6_9BACL|nr:Maf family protein [Caryophanon latum]OCS94688.1 septum formation protein Maf [Caryophanon latum]